MTKVQEKNDSCKRRILKDSRRCLFDLEKELKTLFETFYKAVSLYEKEIILTPPHARCRGHEAVILNSKMIQCVMESFPDNSKFGKYKRFMVRIKGYICFFKKLNNKNMPMNIKTTHSTLLANQKQGKLFDYNDDGSEPILYFGYNKDRFGEIKKPKLVYIDENKVRWQINENDITNYERAVIISSKPNTLKNRGVTLREGTRKDASGQ